MKSANRCERGFVSFSLILGLAVLAAIVFSAIRLLPPYISNYQFQDAIDNLARSATYSTVTEADLRRDVMRQARDVGIQLQEKQVVVQKDRTTVNIAISYEVPVDLLARQVVLKFAPSAGNRNIVAR
ncbi:MAG: DUF4845 domain-containing protein [Terriglobia bacterium]